MKDLSEMKDLNEMYVIGQRFGFLMRVPSKGKRPICRTKEGVLCVIDLSEGLIYPYNSFWECEVLEIREKCLVIKPLNQIYSEDEVEEIVFSTLKKKDNLITRIWKK